jgi:hypothetical protein
MVAIGAAAAIAGIIFALQGFGVLGGSAMSGNDFWAGAGPVIAVAGLILLVSGGRLRSGGRRS